MKKRLIEACAFLLLLVACTTLVFSFASCKPKLTTDTEGGTVGPLPRVDDTAQRLIDDTQPDPPDRSWMTWTECSQKVGDHPCNFSLMDQHGDMVELYDQHGKVIVIDLSTIWCGICNNIATEGDEWVDDYGADNFIWLTILIDNATGDPPTLADTGYPCTGWPTLVVIDQEMVLQYGINGWNESVIRGWVQDLL